MGKPTRKPDGEYPQPNGSVIVVQNGLATVRSPEATPLPDFQPEPQYSPADQAKRQMAAAANAYGQGLPGQLGAGAITLIDMLRERFGSKPIGMGNFADNYKVFQNENAKMANEHPLAATVGQVATPLNKLGVPGMIAGGANYAHSMGGDPVEGAAWTGILAGAGRALQPVAKYFAQPATKAIVKQVGKYVPSVAKLTTPPAPTPFKPDVVGNSPVSKVASGAKAPVYEPYVELPAPNQPAPLPPEPTTRPLPPEPSTAPSLRKLAARAPNDGLMEKLQASVAQANQKAPKTYVADTKIRPTSNQYVPPEETANVIDNSIRTPTPIKNPELVAKADQMAEDYMRGSEPSTRGGRPRNTVPQPPPSVEAPPEPSNLSEPYTGWKPPEQELSWLDKLFEKLPGILGEAGSRAGATAAGRINTMNAMEDAETRRRIRGRD